VDVIVTGALISSNGYYGTSNVVFHVPTNAPTDGQVVTASGTSGITRWADGGSGSGIPTLDGTATNTTIKTLLTLKDAADNFDLTLTPGNDATVNASASDSLTLLAGTAGYLALSGSQVSVGPALQATNLAGTGTRIVTADLNGLLGAGAEAATFVQTQDTRNLKFSGTLTLSNGVAGVTNVISPDGWTAQKGNYTNSGGTMVLQGTTANEFLIAQAALVSSGYVSIKYANPKFGLYRGSTLDHFIYYDTANGDTVVNDTFGAAVKLNRQGVTRLKVDATQVLISYPLIVTNTITATNGFITYSNSALANLTLVSGQNHYLSSNGVPHVIWKDFSGVQHTNDLTAAGGSFDLAADHVFTGSNSFPAITTDTIFDDAATPVARVQFGATTKLNSETGVTSVEINSAANDTAILSAGDGSTQLHVTANKIHTSNGDTVFHGNGGGLSNLNMTLAYSGTLADERLSGNVSLLGSTITPGEVSLTGLTDTHLLYNNAGALDGLPQNTFMFRTADNYATGSNALAILRLEGAVYQSQSSNSTVIDWTKNRTFTQTNQSFTTIISGTVRAGQRYTHSITNQSATNVVNTLAFNAFSISGTQAVSTVTVPAYGVVDLDFYYDGGYYWLRDFGPNDPRLVVLANDNGNNLTNVSGNKIKWPTNSVADVTVIDLTKPYAATNHTANFTIAGLSGLDTSGTNVQWATRFYTNNSVGAKTISVPAAWIDLGSVGTIYNTNQGVLSVVVYPGFGTNFVWRGK